MIILNRHLLRGLPDDIRGELESLACDQDDRQYLAGTRFRELAVKLATCDGLAVSAVTSEDAAVYELEVTLATAPHQDAIVIDRGQHGDHCQISLERWLPIGDAPGLEDAVNVIQAILAASAAPIRQDPSAPRWNQPAQ